MGFKKISKHVLILGLILIFLNTFDAGATLFLFQTGLGYEANPVMAWLLELGVGWFLLFKIGLANALIAFLVWANEKKSTVVALYIILIPYVLLFFYYMIGFLYLFGFLL